ncbi:MAG TPA: VanZ family protein [Burkholderiaceae bacterium]|nr:VanZ family protein [Burkholderiaceae bacterium]
MAGFVLALWPQPNPPRSWFAGADKVQHALSFSVLVWLGVRGGYRRTLALVAGLLVLGGAIEVAQSFTATRTAEWFDWIADAAGIALGAAVVRFEGRRRASRSPGLEQEHGR